MRYSLPCVRMIRLPRTIAGVAIVISLSEFLPRSLNSGPGLHDERVAVLAQHEDLAVVRPGRRGEAARFGGDALPAVDLLAGPRVVAEQKAAVEQRVVVVAVDERRGVVGAEQRLIPGDVVRCSSRPASARCRRTRPAGSRRPDAAPARIAGADVDQAVCRERRRRGQDGHALQFPEQLAVEIVRTALCSCWRSRSRSAASFSQTNGVAQLCASRRGRFARSPGRCARRTRR